MSIPDQLALFELQAPAPQTGGPAESIQPDWNANHTTTPKSRSSFPRDRSAGLRFAFYGRVSTAEYQDPESSMGWQRDSALDLIGSVGRIVVEYFDVGCSRRLAWMDRPQARRLLEALAGPDREFDAIVVGEAERAFCAGQLPAMASTFVEHNVQVWLPELDGPVDPENPVHQAVVLQLGARARREVVRARFRTTAAMRAQARDQGRYLGGRPPYGYRLVDAAPHPNQAHARWGRRLQRLDPDPRAAATVGWIFAERRDGRSVSGIARALNEAGVPCPSAADAERNPHRDAQSWTVTCLATILANPATPATRSGTGRALTTCQ